MILNRKLYKEQHNKLFFNVKVKRTSFKFFQKPLHHNKDKTLMEQIGESFKKKFNLTDKSE